MEPSHQLRPEGRRTPALLQDKDPAVNHLILNQVLTLFLLMAAGLGARRARCLPEAAVKGLTDLLLAFCLPMLVFTSFLRPFSPELMAKAAAMLGCSFLVCAMLTGVGILLYRKAAPERRPGLQFITAYSNSGFLGIPLLAALFPEYGVFYGAIFGIAFNSIVFTAGVMLFAPRGARPGLARVALNPVILGTVAGLLCFLGSLRPPEAVTSALVLMGGMTTPLSMLIIGAMLAEAKPRDLLGGRLEYGVCAARLLLAPLLTLALCALLRADPVLTRVLVLLEALPAAALAAVFTEKYGGDRAFVSRCTFLTTALSLATLPVMLELLARFVR